MRIGKGKETGYFPVLLMLTTTNATIVSFFLQQNGLSHFDELVPRSQDDLFGTLERDANEEI